MFGLLAIVQTVLEILKGFLQWQTVLAQIQARKLVYDIDQHQLAKGRELVAKIDAARNAGDLAALSLYLDDQANLALFAARVRSAIPDLSGTDVGVGSGIPTAPAPSGEPDHSAKPAAGTEPGSAVTTVPPAPTVPVHTIPKAPFSITGPATWWGLNPDGSNDRGDVDQHGKNLLGAFGDDNHNEQIVGFSIPVKVCHETIGPSSEIYGDVEKRRYRGDFLSHTTGRHITGVWLTDLGPAAEVNGKPLGRPFDLTYAANKMLGHTNGTNTVTGWITDTHTGRILEFKGWDFSKGQVI